MASFASDSLHIRRLAGGERRPVVQVFEGLSERSRLRRFLAPKPSLRDAELEHLVDVGCCGRQAVVATDVATGEAVGIARYVRVGADPHTAEVAFEVVDAWQGRGVGRRLIDALAAVAADEGIHRLTATVAVGNQGALALLKRLGRLEWSAYVDGAYEVVVGLEG